MVSPRPAAVPPPARDPTHLEAGCAAASFALPWAASALGAGASMGFYDAAELSAAAHGLGVTHPPGHPLWVAVAALASLLPIGTVPLRIALVSGLLLGVAGRLAYGVALRLARSALDDESLDGRWDRALPPLAALSAALLATVGPAVLRQATRAEVYALAGTLAVAVLALAVDATLPLAVRARATVLALALGGANHHFIALTAAPVALLTVGEHLRGVDWPQRRRALAAWAAFGAIGLSPYALLFLRAGTGASLVRVRTPGDFLWTVSARAFQKNMAGGVPGTFGEHLLDVLEWVGASVTPAGILMALVGAVALLRAGSRHDARPAVARLGLLAVSVFGARALLGFVAGNPDAAGYLVPGVVAVACLSAGFATAFWRAIRTAPAAPEGPSPAARRALVALLVAAPLALPAYAAARGYAATAGDRGYAPEAAAQALLGPLPPRAVVLAYAPETAFRARYAQRVEGERPDVTVVPVPFLPYPGMNNTLLAQDPDLLPLIRDYLARGEARPEEIGALAMARPARIELDPRNVSAMVPYVVLRGPLAEVRGEPNTLAAVRATAAAHFATVDALEAEVAGDGAGLDPKASELLLWRSYNDALFLAARGARPEALTAIRHALTRAPEDRALLGLRDAVTAPGEGPVDVRPFVVGAAPAE